MEWFDYFEMKKKKKTLNEKTLSNIKKKDLKWKDTNKYFLENNKISIILLTVYL
jgi:aspartyl aminopeptidase